MGKKVLFLGDNQSVVLSSNKGRCRNRGVLRLLRRAAAYALEFYPDPGRVDHTADFGQTADVSRDKRKR